MTILSPKKRKLSPPKSLLLKQFKEKKEQCRSENCKEEKENLKNIIESLKVSLNKQQRLNDSQNFKLLEMEKLLTHKDEEILLLNKEMLKFIDKLYSLEDRLKHQINEKNFDQENADDFDECFEIENEPEIHVEPGVEKPSENEVELQPIPANNRQSETKIDISVEENDIEEEEKTTNNHTQRLEEESHKQTSETLTWPFILIQRPYYTNGKKKCTYYCYEDKQGMGYKFNSLCQKRSYVAVKCASCRGYYPIDIELKVFKRNPMLFHGPQCRKEQITGNNASVRPDRPTTLTPIPWPAGEVIKDIEISFNLDELPTVYDTYQIYGITECKEFNNPKLSKRMRHLLYFGVTNRWQRRWNQHVTKRFNREEHGLFLIHEFSRNNIPDGFGDSPVNAALALELLYWRINGMDGLIPTASKDGSVAHFNEQAVSLARTEAVQTFAKEISVIFLCAYSDKVITMHRKGIFFLDILAKSTRIISLLWLLKSISSLILFPIQKPLTSGKTIRKPLFIRICRLSIVNCIVEALWFYGITFCGPLRSVLVFELSPSLLLIAVASFFKGSSTPAKSRGFMLLIVGFVSLMLMDRDQTISDSHADAHGHHSGFHYLRHVIDLFGFGDHQGGVVILFLALLLRIGYDSSFRHLAVEIGGPKRLYALVTAFSAIILIPLAVLAMVFATSSQFSMSSTEFVPLLFVTAGFVMVLDFYAESICFQHVADPVLASARWSPITMFTCALGLAYMWYSNQNKAEHAITGGVLVTVVSFILASISLTSATTKHRGGGVYVGISATGLPLFADGEAFLKKTSQSLFVFFKETLRDILANKDSRRIFYFLCLNFSFCGVEFLYGFWTNNLELISDGFHMLFDCSALVMGLVASVMARWPPSKHFTYGYGRVEVLSGFINALFLCVIAVFILIEALERIFDPLNVNTDKLETSKNYCLEAYIYHIFTSFAFRDTHSIYQLKCLLKDAKTVVIVGNGGIATELVYELQDMAIHWVIRDSYHASVFFLPQVSKFLEHRILEKELQPLSTELFKRDRFTTGVNQSHFEVAGCALAPDWNSTINLSGSSNNRKVTFHCLEEVVDVTSDQSAHLNLTLSNQTSICCDFAIWATGVTTLSGFWKENCSDLKLAQDGGIAVDEQTRTSVHDVFACGDVCTVFWPRIENTWKQMRLWTQARQMGSYCAFSILSNFPTELDFCFEIFAHVTSFCGMKVVFLGDFKGENQPSDWYVRERIIGDTEYVCCVLVNHRVVGATLIGNTQLEETIENLILNKTDLSQIEEHFLDPGIDIEDYFD